MLPAESIVADGFGEAEIGSLVEVAAIGYSAHRWWRHNRQEWLRRDIAGEIYLSGACRNCQNCD